MMAIWINSEWPFIICQGFEIVHKSDSLYGNKGGFPMRILLSLLLFGLLLGNGYARAEGGNGFSQTVELQGISFRVTCLNNGSINILQVAPSGLAIDNTTIEQEIDGTVSGAEVADLNADGYPELYVYVTSAGSGSYGSLIAYGSNRNKSLSAIYFPSVSENEKLAKGYMGHDEFAVGEGALLHRFPIYREGDNNANPTGGMRQIQYKLTQGEAGWVLSVDRTIEY
jgi:hypothetical protein